MVFTVIRDIRFLLVSNLFEFRQLISKIYPRKAVHSSVKFKITCQLVYCLRGSHMLYSDCDLSVLQVAVRAQHSLIAIMIYLRDWVNQCQSMPHAARARLTVIHFKYDWKTINIFTICSNIRYFRLQFINLHYILFNFLPALNCDSTGFGRHTCQREWTWITVIWRYDLLCS